MEELESQIAKIQLGSPKQASAFVYVLTEKSSGSETELYLVAELPLLNPAATEACERITLAIAGGLKRAYRRQPLPGHFEAAVAQINDELGKLAATGEVEWINKLNCIIGVKLGDEFSIATCGKTVGLLLRGGEFADIAGQAAPSHPLKTFDNYATGRLRASDILLLSTTQILNYLSLDRLRGIFNSSNFLSASQAVVQLLKDSAGPEVAFGTIINQQVPQGQAAVEVDLEDFAAMEPARPAALRAALGKLWLWVKQTMFWHKNGRVPKTGLPVLPGRAGLGKLSGGTKNVLATGRRVWTALGKGLAASSHTFNPKNIKQFSPQKKFFFASAVILLLALAINLAVAAHVKQTRQQTDQINAQLKQAQTLLANAQSSLLYRDQRAANQYLAQAESQMPKASQVTAASRQLYESVLKQLQDLEDQSQKKLSANISDLGALAPANFVVNLPGFLAVPQNGHLISYEYATGKIEDGRLKIADTILGQVYASQNFSVIYNGNGLRLWDSTAGTLSPVISQNLPTAADFGGLAYYGTNNRVYAVNKKTAQIISYEAASGNLVNPKVAVKDPVLATTKDLAIDGAIYVLTPNGISKFQSGKPASFTLPFLAKPFSGAGKLYTQKSFKNLYLLDSGTNQIVIMDKTGLLIGTISDSRLNNLTAFVVDEANKIIYALNGASLLKITWQ
ncbi:MAG: PQQ-like beta-propeller repeat protein [Patescibacteria group bacterium]|nr:PQQ-like beta-propeller repeat protein [Patescibacteria group bacterium]